MIHICTYTTPTMGFQIDRCKDTKKPVSLTVRTIDGGEMNEIRMFMTPEQMRDLRDLLGETLLTVDPHAMEIVRKIMGENRQEIVSLMHAVCEPKEAS